MPFYEIKIRLLKIVSFLQLEGDLLINKNEEYYRLQSLINETIDMSTIYGKQAITTSLFLLRAIFNLRSFELAYAADDFIKYFDMTVKFIIYEYEWNKKKSNLYEVIMILRKLNANKKLLLNIASEIENNNIRSEVNKIILMSAEKFEKYYNEYSVKSAIADTKYKLGYPVY